MREQTTWTLERGPADVDFTSPGGAGFSLDTSATNGSSAHSLVTSAFEFDDGDHGAIQIAGTCHQGSDAPPPGLYLTCLMEFLDRETVIDTSKHRVDAAAGAFTILHPGRPDSASSVRISFSLNRAFHTHISVSDVTVAVKALAEDSPLVDAFREGYAWPGTPSMRWLAGKKMYICAGCELTYLSEFMAQSGLDVHHTFGHNEAMDPVMEAANPATEMWNATADFIVLSTVQHFRSLLSSHEQSRSKFQREVLEERLDDYIGSLSQVIARLREVSSCPIWLFTHPYTSTSAYGLHDYRIRDGSISAYELTLILKLTLYSLARGYPSVYVLDPDQALEVPGKGTPDRPLVRPHETLGGHPERTGSRYIAELLHHQMLVVSRTAERVKAVVVDCDNTLWNGVIREDGPEGIDLHKTRMQRLWHLGLRGIPIALCSKNDPEDEELILETLRSYGKLHEKIITTRFNWLPKSENIRSIAQQLNVGLDTIAYFDDSPFEREEVTTALREVRAFPDTEIVLAPDWHVFQPVGDLSPEAQSRVEKYKEEASRASSQASFADDGDGFEQFLHSCQLRLEAREAQAAEISRVDELLQRTNQMNATLKRLDANQILEYHRKPDRSVHIVKLGDKFGDYGLIGTSLTEARPHGLHIVELALSCRAMGRRVEDALLEELLGFASDKHLPEVTIDVTRTSRNQQILETLERVGFAEDGSTDNGEGPATWRLALDGDRTGREFAPWFAWDRDIGDL